MATRKTPAPQRAGTRSDNRGALLLAATGDDPETLSMLIRMMESVIANRSHRRGKKKVRSIH